MEIDAFDEKEGYCRMLGHHVPFRYCRMLPGQEIPCRRIRDCWFAALPIDAYLEKHEPGGVKPQEPAPKIASLVELIEQARQRAGQSQETEDKP